MESLSALASQINKDILTRISARQRIANIEVKGNLKIESSVITQTIKGSRGSLYSGTQLAEDIKSIYKLGYFDDVSADVTDTPEGKVIAFMVKEKGLVTSIIIKGNKAVDTSDIESSLAFKTKQTVNQDKITSSLEKIKTLYDNKGYYNAEISYTIDKIGEKDLRVNFDIKENAKLYLIAISFEGNRTYRDKALKNIMKTSEKDFFYWFTDAGVLKKDQLKQDVNKINAFYLNNGFIHAQVGEPDVSYDKKGIYIKIPITEGRQFKIGKVDISGDELKVSKAELLKNLTINKKEYFDRGAIIKDIDYLTGAGNDEGYAYVDINPKTQANDKEQTVDVTYDIEKGNIVYFNRISIIGNTKTRDKVIRRMIAITEGDMYNSSKLKLSYKYLERLRYFEEVDFQAEKGPHEGLTDISIRVKEKPTGMFSVGAGYSALDGAMAMASISQQNLFGRGQSLSLKATLGSVANYYNLSFIEPWLFDTPLWSKLDLWNTVRTYDTYTLQTSGFGATLGYPLWEKIYGYLQYTLSNSDVYEIQSTASSLISQQAGKLLTSALSPTLSRDTTDDDYFPTKGSRNSLYMTHAGTPLGGDASYDKYGAATAWFFLLPLDMVFDIKGRIGYLQANEGKPLPVYEKYYVGGINSIRGLRYYGPKDPVTGDLIGGTTMLYFNFDLVFPLIKNAGMKGVVFFDAGNAWESGYRLDDMRKTAGIGVRWYSPMGPLRLEWGYVLDRKDGEDPSRFEFTMGMMM
jgi:outer membrane protein insertion porin family